MKSTFLFFKRFSVLILLAILQVFLSGNGKRQKNIPKQVSEERRWTGTITLEQRYSGITGTSERHVSVSFNNAWPTLHRDGVTTTELNFTDDKGTGSETFHGDLIIEGKKMGTTDCQGSGQTELHIVDINDEDYYIHAIGPSCTGTDVDLINGITTTVEPYTTDITIDDRLGIRNDILSGAKTETTDIGGGTGTVTTTTTWHLVRSTDIINDPCTTCGSVIGIETQSLGHVIAITGTPFALRYRSDRPWIGEGSNIGGWTFNVHHAFLGQQLQLGDGRQRTVGDSRAPIKAAVNEIAGVIPAGGYLVASDNGSEAYVFDSGGRHLRTLDAITNTLTYEFKYNANSELTAIVDVYGQATTIERNSSGLPVVIVSPYGQRTELILDNNQKLTSIINPAGEKHSFSYSSSGLLTGMIDTRGFSHSYEYDPAGRLIKDVDPSGGFTSLSLVSNTNGHTVAVSSALGRSTKYSVANQTAGVSKRIVTLPDGSKNTLITWPDGRRKVEFGDGTEATSTDQPDPRWGSQAPLTGLLTVKVPSGLTSTLTVARRVTLADPANPLSSTGFIETLTVNGRVFTRDYVASNRTTTVTSPLGRRVLTTLDATGRVAEVVTPGLAAVRVTYDKNGHPVILEQGSAPDTRRYNLAYDAMGYVKSVTDPLGHINSFLYDAAGRVTQATSPDARTIMIRYDATGNVTTVMSDGRPAHYFEYDKINQVSKYASPDVGSGHNVTRYEYNADNQMTRLILPDGQAIDMSYNLAGCNCDKLGSLITSTGTRLFRYHPTTGKLTGIASPGGITLARKYDGMLLTSESWSGPVAGTVDRRYNSDFKIIAHSVNDGPAISYLYDDDGFLTRAGDLVLSRSALNSLISGSTLGEISENWTYNSFAEITKTHTNFNAVPLLDIEYTRDKLGRIISKRETIDGVTNNFSYSYDLAGCLVAVSKNGITNSTYQYDGNGNLLSVKSPTGTMNGTYDDQDRLLKCGNATNTFSFNGELLTRIAPDGTTTYRYDALGNLLRVNLPTGTLIEYLVDGRDRRIAKKINGTMVQGFLYQDGLRITAELDGNGKVVARFVYGTRNNVPDYLIKGGTKYRILADHLGSPRLIVDMSNGVITQRMDYDVLGNVLADSNPGFQPFGFAGGLYDRDTKMTRFGARDYDGSTGRFTTKDPLGIEAGDLNLYRYAKNDPVNWIDPTGLSATIQCDGKGGYEVVLNEYAGHPAEACVSAHERQHIKDWKERYGEESCKGKAKGYLPTSSKVVGSNDYPDFLQKSECAAHNVGLGCAVGKKFTASDKDKPLIDEYVENHTKLKKAYCGR